MKYKPSMFNYFCEAEDCSILYNSYQGCKSITKLGRAKKEKINSILHKDEIEEETFDADLNKLQERGFLVPSTENEKLKRDALFYDWVTEPELFLVITVTEKCNFCCVYCALDFAKPKMELQTQQNIVDFIRKNIHKYKSVRIEWFGGEPLLCMDVIENISLQVLEICRRNHKLYTASITSNGYLLTLGNFRKLFDWKVIGYQITLDGLQEDHDNQRCLQNKKGTFDTILHNLLDIKENIKSAYFKINIRTNFTRTITEKLDQYVSFYEKNFSGDKRFVFIARTAADWGGDRVKEFESLLDKQGEKETIEKLASMNPKLEFLANYRFLEPCQTVCHAVKRNMYNIGSDGLVYKCDSTDQNTLIGVLKNGGIMELDTYKDMFWSFGTRFIDAECDNCFFSCSCVKGGCPKRAAQNNQRSSSECSFEKDNLDAILKLFIQNYEVEMI